jgi:hypothetical protein
MYQEYREREPTTMRRFLVFVGDVYYPGKATQDLVGSADTFVEAYQAVEQHEHAPKWEYHWWRIVDHATMQDLCSGEGGV